jgi:hypothetical protein
VNDCRVQDLDDTHLLVQPQKMEMVREEVRVFRERSQFVPGR